MSEIDAKLWLLLFGVIWIGAGFFLGWFIHDVLLHTKAIRDIEKVAQQFNNAVEKFEKIEKMVDKDE